MHAGKLVFAQVMDHLAWKTFGRVVERYGGDGRVRGFSCANQFRCMAFAQLTYRESLRDIVTCLRAQATKLYHLGIRGAIAKSTLADANEARDWRIYAETAQHLIRIARRLYVDESFGVDLKETVYALDSTTIDLCLALFPWAPFRSTKAAIKLHTLIDLRGNIPSFIHISDGKLLDVNVLDQLPPEPGAFYVMDRAGPTKLDRPIGDRTAPTEVHFARSRTDETTQKEPLSGVQGEGGAGGDPRRPDACRAVGALRGAPQPDHAVEDAVA